MFILALEGSHAGIFLSIRVDTHLYGSQGSLRLRRLWRAAWGERPRPLPLPRGAVRSTGPAGEPRLPRASASSLKQRLCHTQYPESLRVSGVTPVHNSYIITHYFVWRFFIFLIITVNSMLREKLDAPSRTQQAMHLWYQCHNG